MRRPDIIVFDTETTGLTLHPDADAAKQPRCIEFGAALLSGADGSILDTINLMVNPGIPITEEITKITGITDADVADAPPFGDHLPAISSFFARAGAVMAHNLPFDKAIMLGEFRRLGFNEDFGTFPWPDIELCTVGIYKEQWGRNPRLIELYPAVLGKPLAQTHRALDDVMALVEVIQADKLWELV